jgi:2-polyprenyl-3-methyl-5-hydroxy-6-metoxy-1,4-benzoquinol methylase
MNNENYLPDVKTQYEQLPYPPVDPQDERRRLQRTWLDDLPMINHYCFGGRQSFRAGFRVLVAGGGTGDATIFLAEQLRATNAEIVHLDLSRASIAIAQERARLRGLDNIRWVNASLLDLASLGLGEFDYINCVGVLHHLADPDAGLRALLQAVRNGGGMGLMLYGAIGRTGIYHMQRLLRLAQAGCGEAEKIAHAKEVLAALPRGNWYRLAGDLYGDHKLGDAGIYDSLLHSQDRAYTVTEIFEWLQDRHGLHLEFSDVQRGRFPYLPNLTLGPDARRQRARLPAMPLRDRYAMSELLVGDLTRHNFYATPGSQAAPYGDPDYVPFFFHEPLDGRALEAMFAPKAGQPTILHHPFLGMTAAVDAGRYSGKVLRHVDGKRTFGQIFDMVRSDPAVAAAAPDNAALFADFRATYEVLNAIERLLLRHRACQPL